jgi:hypothetical protein
VQTTVCWDRTASEVIGVFNPQAVSWLRKQLGGYSRLLEWRYGKYTTDDPTARALGMPLPTEPAQYPPLVAALRAIVPADEVEAVLLWREPDILRWLHAAAEIVLDTLPQSGGVVVLRQRHQIDAWKVAVSNMRIVFAVATHVWPVPAGTEHKLYTLPKREPKHLERDRALVEWLKSVVDGLERFSETAAA